MLKGLKRLAGGGLLLLELRGMRAELAGLRSAVEALTALLADYSAKAFPQTTVVQAVETAEGPGLEITYAAPEQIHEWMEIELRLTAATGQPPTEEQMLAEWDRLHPASGGQSGSGVTG